MSNPNVMPVEGLTNRPVTKDRPKAPAKRGKAPASGKVLVMPPKRLAETAKKVVGKEYLDEFRAMLKGSSTAAFQVDLANFMSDPQKLAALEESASEAGFYEAAAKKLQEVRGGVTDKNQQAENQELFVAVQDKLKQIKQERNAQDNVVQFPAAEMKPTLTAAEQAAKINDLEAMVDKIDAGEGAPVVVSPTMSPEQLAVLKNMPIKKDPETSQPKKSLLSRIFGRG